MRIRLPYPPSVNAYYRVYAFSIRGKPKARIILSEEGRSYKESAGFIARKQGVRPIDGELVVTIRLYRPRKIGDIDAPHKALLDSLNGVAWRDDKQIVELHTHRHDDKADPRVEVEVRAKTPPAPGPTTPWGGFGTCRGPCGGVLTEEERPAGICEGCAGRAA